MFRFISKSSLCERRNRFFFYVILRLAYLADNRIEFVGLTKQYFDKYHIISENFKLVNQGFMCLLLISIFYYNYTIYN